jgi:glycosyltransferase involved in cell wall biosynthesis
LVKGCQRNQYSGYDPAVGKLNAMEAIKVAIGLFAHNEQGNILNTLQSLATQDIFVGTGDSGLSVCLTVVANGCTDNTVAIASEYLRNNHIIDGQVIG